MHFLNTQVKYIITLNNLSESQVIEGQTLRIPISEKPAPEASATTASAPASTATAVSKPAAVSTQKVTYTVKRGDTLSDVALKYNTTVPKLQALNNKKSSSIYAGERLIVGEKAVAQAPAGHKVVHKVKSGETLGQIAINYGVPSKDIIAWNNKSSSVIYVNENLTIYTKNAPKAPAVPTVTHTVRSGENLSTIAVKYSTSASEIKKLNNKKNDRIYVGEKLKVTAKASQVSQPVAAAASKIPANSRSIRYKVRRGDTLDQIAINHRVSRSQMLAWNNKRNTRIYIGESLKIYVPNVAKAPVSKAAPKVSPNVGVNSNKFKDVPLPVKYANIVSTSVSGRGVELVLDKKQNIDAPNDGVVQFAGYIKALQNVVILQLDSKRTVVYAGMEKLSVQTGQTVAKGRTIGSTGISPTDKKPYLYIEIRDEGKVVNVLNSYSDLKNKQRK